MMRYTRLAVLCGIAAVMATAAQAITFSNIQIQSPPLSTGSSSSVLGNAISFFTPNAIVGDPVDPLRAGNLQIQYDAFMGGNEANAVGVNVNLGAVALGSGTIVFTEQIIELDSNGNEINGVIGFAQHIFTANDSPFWSSLIELDHSVRAFRAKKSFVMSAPDTNAFDVAAVATVNQNVVVPEPATLAGLGLGALALGRRLRKRS